MIASTQVRAWTCCLAALMLLGPAGCDSGNSDSSRPTVNQGQPAVPGQGNRTDGDRPTQTPAVRDLDGDGKEDIDLDNDGKPDVDGLEECLELLRDGADLQEVLDCIEDAVGKPGKPDKPGDDPVDDGGSPTSTNVSCALNNERVDCVDGTCTCYRDGKQVGQACQQDGCTIATLADACCFKN